MQELVRRMWQDDGGQDIAEYAIMLAVIALIVIASVQLIGTNANTVFKAIADKLTTPPAQ